jgi:hypothetical protein
LRVLTPASVAALAIPDAFTVDIIITIAIP